MNNLRQDDVSVRGRCWPGRRSSLRDSGLSRRVFLQTGLAAGASAAGALGFAAPALAPALKAEVAPEGKVIDIHHHVFPPTMIEILKQRLPAFALAEAERSIEAMDRAAVDAAMISFPNSDITKNDQSRLSRMIREYNDYTAGTLQKHPGRYGLFASLPMPYIDASLAEIEHALDELKADGVLLITNYENKWLGDPKFAPVLEELNRRKAVVYTHPNAADCCIGLVPNVSDSIIEFGTDTARTIASLLFSGTAARLKDIRFIFSHAGGTMPGLIERFVRAPDAAPALKEAVPEGVTTYLRRFFYDTAQAANPMALGSLLKIVAASQVLFGTDFPYRTAEEHIKSLRDMKLGDPALRGIFHENAQRLFPRFKA